MVGPQLSVELYASTWNKLLNNLKTANNVNCFKYDIKQERIQRGFTTGQPVCDLKFLSQINKKTKSFLK